MRKFKIKLTGTIVLALLLIIVPIVVLAITKDEIQIISKTTEFYGRRKLPRHVLSFLKNNATASKKPAKAYCTRFKAAKPFRQQCQRSFYGELHLLYIKPL